MYKQKKPLLDQGRKATDHIRIDIRLTFKQTIWLKNGTVGTVQYFTGHSIKNIIFAWLLNILFWWKLLCTVKVSMSYLCTIPLRLTTLTFLLTLLCTMLTILSLPQFNYGFTLSSGNFATATNFIFTKKRELSYIFPFWKCEDLTNFGLWVKGIKGSFECKGFLNRVIGNFETF